MNKNQLDTQTYCTMLAYNELACKLHNRKLFRIMKLAEARKSDKWIQFYKTTVLCISNKIPPFKYLQGVLESYYLATGYIIPAKSLFSNKALQRYRKWESQEANFRKSVTLSEFNMSKIIKNMQDDNANLSYDDAVNLLREYNLI